MINNNVCGITRGVQSTNVLLTVFTTRARKICERGGGGRQTRTGGDEVRTSSTHQHAPGSTGNTNTKQIREHTHLASQNGLQKGEDANHGIKWRQIRHLCTTPPRTAKVDIYNSQPQTFWTHSRFVQFCYLGSVLYNKGCLGTNQRPTCRQP